MPPAAPIMGDPRGGPGPQVGEREADAGETGEPVAGETELCGRPSQGMEKS